MHLGIDSSTQGIKALVIDVQSGGLVAGAAVNFGRDMPMYLSPSGFLPNSNPLVRHADPLMWLDGLDLVLSRLSRSGADLSKIAAVSGSGQQHGSVYLNDTFDAALASLDRAGSLASQLSSVFSRKTSPIWMDRSTATECREISRRFGAKVQRITGSPATERFTGPQILKFRKDSPQAYADTTRVHLVSSFLCSVLCGASSPIDYGDGAGMNLLDLKTLKWDEEITAFTASDLFEKLPRPVASSTMAGGLSPYFAKYGLEPGTPVIVWSGDNPNSLVGTGASRPGRAAISLGTSDTFFAVMEQYATDPQGFGHVFGNPAGGFMSLTCFTNGSLAREKVFAECGATLQYADGEACATTRPGNGGRLMLPYYGAESTPPVLEPRVVRNFDATTSTPAENVRAIFESQALSMRLHSQWLGKHFDCIRVTGGASRSTGFLQIIADVFQSRVETIQTTDSAALGAAMRAAAATYGNSFEELTEIFCRTEHATEPNPANQSVYEAMLSDYAALENNRF